MPMTNPNMTSGQVVPGFYGSVDYNSQGSQQAPDNRVLLWGFIGATAQRTPNQPFLPGSQQEADDGCEQGSDAANYYAAALAQPEAQGAEVWIMPIAPPSSGTASIYKFQVFVPNTNPAKPGTLAFWMDSVAAAQVGFTATDTATTIGDALVAALNANKDLPIGTATNATGVISIPLRHKGTTGEDHAFRINISPSQAGCGVYFGQVAALATNATGAGSIKFTFGNTSVSTALAGGETPAQAVTKVIASFNADTYPLYALADATTSKVDLVFANDKDVRRIVGSVITSTGLTVDLGSGATDGSGSPTVFTYNGTLGAGAPSLTAALANLANHEQFRSWAAPWIDTATVGAIATSMANASNGSQTGQKLQRLTIIDAQDQLSVAGAIPTGTSPNLTTSDPYFTLGWAPDAAVPGMYLAARLAAAIAAVWTDTPQKNWNAYQFKGSTRSPILLPPSKPSLDNQNTALRTYALAPIVKGTSGNMELVKGRTTSLASDNRKWAISAEMQASFHVFDLKITWFAPFAGGSIVRYSTPKAAGLFDKASFETAVRNAMRAWELAGHYDGADAFKDAVIAQLPDPGNPFRVNVSYPESPVVDLDQIVFESHFSSPAQ